MLKSNYFFRSMNQGWFQGPPIMGPLMVSFPYNSHIFKDSYGSGTGIVWGPRGSHVLEGPWNPTEWNCYINYLPQEASHVGNNHEPRLLKTKWWTFLWKQLPPQIPLVEVRNHPTPHIGIQKKHNLKQDNVFIYKFHIYIYIISSGFMNLFVCHMFHYTIHPPQQAWPPQIFPHLPMWAKRSTAWHHESCGKIRVSTFTWEGSDLFLLVSKNSMGT